MNEMLILKTKLFRFSNHVRFELLNLFKTKSLNATGTRAYLEKQTLHVCDLSILKNKTVQNYNLVISVILLVFKVTNTNHLELLQQ